jgi:DNA-binding NarL/FixJ family response regulator
MAARPIRILTADDHAVLRDGVAALIATQPDMQLIGEVDTGLQAVAAFRALNPDVTLMDLQMPGMSGLEAIAAILAEHPQARIMVLTTYDGDVQALRALKAGAYGYLLKSALRRELIDTIRLVHAGRRYVPPEVAQEIALHAAQDSLTPRETLILELLASGKQNKIIAFELSLSEETVKAHLRSVYSKLGVIDRTQAVMTALRRGIISL